MGRWEPDARGRLFKAALELFEERGYADTTVAQIAERAGLTERTFFRHFADKREVLYLGSSALETLVLESIAQAPSDRSPFTWVVDALAALNVYLSDRPRSRARQALIDAHPELQEREQAKLQRLGAVVAQALRDRGVAEPAASLTAEAFHSVFKVAFLDWLKHEPDDFATHVRATAAALRGVIGDQARVLRAVAPRARPASKKRRVSRA